MKGVGGVLSCGLANYNIDVVAFCVYFLYLFVLCVGTLMEDHRPHSVFFFTFEFHDIHIINFRDSITSFTYLCRAWGR